MMMMMMMFHFIVLSQENLCSTLHTRCGLDTRWWETGSGGEAWKHSVVDLPCWSHQETKKKENRLKQQSENRKTKRKVKAELGWGIVFLMVWWIHVLSINFGKTSGTYLCRSIIKTQALPCRDFCSFQELQDSFHAWLGIKQEGKGDASDIQVLQQVFPLPPI